jgi:hypothetical protein
LTGKVLDRISNTCSLCEAWEKKDKTGIEYLEWYIHHEPSCLLNHTGSAQSMESGGAVQLFGRSLIKHNLRYKTYIGDGDSKSYESVVKSQPYGPVFVIVKEECVGHVQKRMGTRLRTLVSLYKGM